jgi:hypothetical protein
LSGIKNEIHANTKSPREKMFQKLSSGYYRLNAEHTRCKVSFSPCLCFRIALILLLQQDIAPGVNQGEWKRGSCQDHGFGLAVKGSFVGTHEWVKK